jgi:hypothetical protein
VNAKSRPHTTNTLIDAPLIDAPLVWDFEKFTIWFPYVRLRRCASCSRPGRIIKHNISQRSVADEIRPIDLWFFSRNKL